jgi:hypothetical protein
MAAAGPGPADVSLEMCIAAFRAVPENVQIVPSHCHIRLNEYL